MPAVRGVRVPAWCQAYLAAIEEVAPGGLLVGDAVLAAFWGGRLGPSLLPLQLEVRVPADLPAPLLTKTLRHRLGRRRLVVRPFPPQGPHGEPAVGEGAVRAARTGLLRQHGEVVLLAEQVQALDDLLQGRLEPAGPPSEETVHQMTRLVGLYPAVRAPLLSYDGRSVAQSWEEIHQLVTAGEFGGSVRPFRLGAAEREAAKAVADWHRRAQPHVQWMAWPEPEGLPDGDPWWAEDGAFRTWLMQQTVEDPPAASPDPWLAEVLRDQRGGQKPTHQGWEIHQHALLATLMLGTDTLPRRFRRALRVAMLLHDVGKLYNVWTPGCHALVGAKIWHRWRPWWLTANEARWIGVLIAAHDAFGLLDRALEHPGYRGGVDPDTIRRQAGELSADLRQGVALLRAVYEADVGSVPALRWLLPLTPLLERVVLATASGGRQWGGQGADALETDGQVAADARDHAAG